MFININEMIVETLKKSDNQNPIKVSYDNKLRYYNDFIEVMNTFKGVLNDKEIKELINDKIQLESKYNQNHYLQAVSEISVLYYILRKYNNKFLYEPKYNGKKNPECCFDYNGKTINIEVKCPDLTKRIECEENKTLKIVMPERIPDHKNVLNEIKEVIKPNLNNSNYSDVEELSRLDNKLKDFLISASGKFPKSDDTNFNILVVSLDIIDDLDEWYLYIFGNNGVFTNNSFIPLEKYENVDAILLTTAMCGHIRYGMFTENVWNLEETINLLFLNPNKENSDTGSFYFNNAITMFGDLTVLFLRFLEDLDKKSQNDWNKAQNNAFLQQIKWTEQKIISSNVISEFTTQMKEGKLFV